jgi:hypothetical protein
MIGTERTGTASPLRADQALAQRYLDTAKVILLGLDLEGRITWRQATSGHGSAASGRRALYGNRQARCEMKRIIMPGASPGLDPHNRFGTAWVAAFLGVVLIIGTVFWAVTAFE